MPSPRPHPPPLMMIPPLVVTRTAPSTPTDDDPARAAPGHLLSLPAGPAAQPPPPLRSSLPMNPRLTRRGSAPAPSSRADYSRATRRTLCRAPPCSRPRTSLGCWGAPPAPCPRAAASKWPSAQTGTLATLIRTVARWSYRDRPCQWARVRGHAATVGDAMMRDSVGRNGGGVRCVRAGGPSELWN